MIFVLVYLLNALLVFILVKGFARAGDLGRRWSRVTALSVVFLLDACLVLWFDCSARAIAYLVIVFCAAATTFPDELTRDLSQALREKRLVIYASSVFTVAAIYYVYLPITTFLTSPGELSVHLEYLVQNNARSTIVVTYVASLLYVLGISPRIRSLLTLFAVGGLVLTLIYAYVYPFGYPMLNGLMFERVSIPASKMVLRGVVDVATVIAVLLGTAFALIKLGTRRVLFAIAFVNASLILASVVSATSEHADEGKIRSTASIERPIRFAKGKNNVLVLFLDRFMGGFVERILKDDPHLAADMDGFVWYPRTLSAGENSIAGLHPLLGGYDYTVHEFNRRNRPLRDVSIESFGILPHNFTRKGYVANLVNPHGLGFTVEGDCSFLRMPGLNCTHIPISVTKKLADQYGVPMHVLADSMYADLLVLLGLMRGTPYLMRAVIHERGPWRPFLDHSAGTTFKQWAELKSLPALSTIDAAESNLNIVFNALPHEPYFMGDNCVPQPKPTEAPPKSGFANTFAYQHYVAARCALRLVADYMKWLRGAGVYDDTKIVVVSDHGIVGPVEDRSSRAVAGGTTDNVFVRSRSLLLIKNRNVHGPMLPSDEYLPNAEVPRIVCEEIGGCVNPYLGNRTIEAHGRDLPFTVSFVPWQFNLQEPNRFRVNGEMVLEGRDPYDIEAWRHSRGAAAPEN